MKKPTLILIVLCFLCFVQTETFGQTRKPAKKSVKPKLVKCYVKGKIVYRKKCTVRRVPSPTVALETNPTMVVKPEKQNEPTTTDPYGVLSDGQGTGGGMGAGRGQGEGNGVGNGTGDLDGTVNNDKNKPKTTSKTNKKPKGPTTALRILSKPRPSYTDAARQNNVQGTVTLRITFSANGQISGVSVVQGLPYGLTEQAIAAARNIRFEPAKKNGVPYSVTRAVQFNFTIY